MENLSNNESFTTFIKEINEKLILKGVISRSDIIKIKIGYKSIRRLTNKRKSATRDERKVYKLLRNNNLKESWKWIKTISKIKRSGGLQGPLKDKEENCLISNNIDKAKLARAHLSKLAVKAN